MHSSDTIVFVLTRRLRDRQYLASVVSRHRSIDVTFIHRSWEVNACVSHPVKLTCGTLPLESVTYSDPQPDLRPSIEDLIRSIGENEVELDVPSPVERLGLPVFLTTGQPIAACYYPIRFHLRTRCWGDTPDFQAGLTYWIRRYQKYKVSGENHYGENYYKEWLADIQKKREGAARLEIATGDVLPLTVRNSTGLSVPGCLLIGEAESHGLFRGTLCVLGEQDLANCKIERRVYWEESGKAFEIDTVIAEIAN